MMKGMRWIGVVLALGAGASCLPGSSASDAAAAFEYTSGFTVAEVQGILRQLGYLRGTYHRGELDGPTVEALSRFQRAHALRPTGQVDGETLAQLLQHRPSRPGESLVLKGVRFDPGSARLNSESMLVLDRVARSLGANPHVRIEIAGHADSTGASTYNRRLSQERADAVRDYLVSRGVAASRLETRSHGSRRPIADNDTGSGRAQNRRVELAQLG